MKLQQLRSVEYYIILKDWQPLSTANWRHVQLTVGQRERVGEGQSVTLIYSLFGQHWLYHFSHIIKLEALESRDLLQSNNEFIKLFLIS